MKICTKCNVEKEESAFGKYNPAIDKLNPWCKDCCRGYSREYKTNNKEKIKSYKEEYNNKYFSDKVNKLKYEKYKEEHREEILIRGKNYYKKNKEQIKDRRLKRLNNPINKDKIKNKQKQRLKDDPLYKLKRNIRCRINAALKNNNFTKSQRLDQYLGCTPEQLKLHLELQFYSNPETNEEMSWSNHGTYGWHIDHIIPLSSAKTIEELYKLNHYTNLQPLWAKENLSKGNKCENLY